MVDTFTVKRNDGTTDVAFAIVPTSDGSVVYRSTDSTPSAPTTVKFVFADKPVGTKGSDRRHVNVQIVSTDSLGNPDVTSASLQWTLPRSAAGLASKYDDAMAVLINVLALPGMRAAIKQGRVA